MTGIPSRPGPPAGLARPHAFRGGGDPLRSGGAGHWAQRQGYRGHAFTGRVSPHRAETLRRRCADRASPEVDRPGAATAVLPGHPALGAADYKLSCRPQGQRGVYTFCMCPGGTVVAAASEEGRRGGQRNEQFARDAENSTARCWWVWGRRITAPIIHWRASLFKGGWNRQHTVWEGLSRPAPKSEGLLVGRPSRAWGRCGLPMNQG